MKKIPMKVYVFRTSEFYGKNGEVREYKSLDDCVADLLTNEDFKGWSPELVVSRPDDITPDIGKSCDYEVEIYDSWRE